LFSAVDVYVFYEQINDDDDDKGVIKSSADDVKIYSNINYKRD